MCGGCRFCRTSFILSVQLPKKKDLIPDSPILLYVCSQKSKKFRKHFENSVTVPLKKCKFSVQKPKQWTMKLQNRQAGDLRPGGKRLQCGQKTPEKRRRTGGNAYGGEKGGVLITGRQGIGAAAARRFAPGGWDVAVNYCRSRAAAEELAAELRELGVHAEALPGTSLSRRRRPL